MTKLDVLELIYDYCRQIRAADKSIALNNIDMDMSNDQFMAALFYTSDQGDAKKNELLNFIWGALQKCVNM